MAYAVGQPMIGVKAYSENGSTQTMTHSSIVDLSLDNLTDLSSFLPLRDLVSFGRVCKAYHSISKQRIDDRLNTIEWRMVFVVKENDARDVIKLTHFEVGKVKRPYARGALYQIHGKGDDVIRRVLDKKVSFRIVIVAGQDVERYTLREERGKGLHHVEIGDLDTDSTLHGKVDNPNTGCDHTQAEGIFAYIPDSDIPLGPFNGWSQAFSVVLITTRGPRGPIGAQGAQGPAGPMGAQGPAGRTHTKGAKKGPSGHRSKRR